MYNKNWFIVAVISLIITGCADKLPSQVFIKASDGKTHKPYFNNTIYANSHQVVSIKMQNVSLCGLDESSAKKAGSLGNREVLLYADIRKNGIVESTHVISDIVRDVTECESMTLTSPLFFRRPLNQGDYYEIVIRAYESDTPAVAKLVRATPTSMEKFGQDFSSNALFTSIKTLFSSIVDVVVSLTGKNIDTWVAQLGATKIMEQYLYVVYDDSNLSTGIQDTALTILGKDFIQVTDQNMTEMKNEFKKKIEDLSAKKEFDTSVGSIMELKVTKHTIN